MISKRIISTCIVLHFMQTHSSCSTLLNLSADALEKSHGKIIYSSMIIIHGERTFESRYPDLVFPPDSWREGEGQLTKLGKQESYNLGKWCRERYIEKIKNGYNHSYVSVDSTVVDRTIMTAQAFLAGMFPPLQNETWASDGLRWQPIPVRTRTNRVVDMIHGEKECPRYELEFVNMNKLPDVQALYKDHEDLFDYIREHSEAEWKFINAPFYSIYRAWHIYNYFRGLEILNMTIPEWGHKIYPEPLFSVGALHYTLFTHTPLMKRLEAGPLLKQILTEMKKKTGASTFVKQFHVYSTHETILIGFLNTLGIYDDIIPKPASMLLIELREKGNEYIVTMVYKNSSVDAPVLMKLPRSDHVCTLAQFTNLLKAVTPEDWNDECKISHVDRMSLIYDHLWLLIIVGSILAVSILLCILRACRVRSYEQIR